VRAAGGTYVWERCWVGRQGSLEKLREATRVVEEAWEGHHGMGS
jgi:hypothetical protein